jgi:PPOX class probable F420-dependent enzyme
LVEQRTFNPSRVSSSLTRPTPPLSPLIMVELPYGGVAVLLAFLRTRHHALLMTTKRDGRPQLSPVSAGVDAEGRVVVATYPQRAKVANARRAPQVSMRFLSDDWDGPWVQVDGAAEVLELPDALEAFVDYYRSIAGEHPDWKDYRAAMVRQGKVLLRVTVESWGPIATGGFPPELGPAG